jgi:hypothetical protein
VQLFGAGEMSEFLLLLWLADVVDGLGGLALAGSLGLVFYGMCASGILSNEPALAEKVIKIGRNIAIVVVCIAVLAFIAPSKQTIYIAAAGSATNTALQTETGKKLVQAFNKKVDEYLKEGKE